MGDAQSQQRADVLVPMLKAWGTDLGCEVASLGLQVHGGVGFVEEAGAAQFYCDVRIAPIYEGTNGIQAADLVTRKLGYANGRVLNTLLMDIAAGYDADSPLVALAQDCMTVAAWMIDDASLDDKLAGSVPFCTMCAVAVAGWQLARQALSAEESDSAIAKSKRVINRYFNEQLVAEARGLRAAAMGGADIIYALNEIELIN